MANRMRTPRKEKQWAGLGGQDFALTADGTSAGSVPLSFTSSQTILRMLGGYQIMATGTITALDAVRIFVGLAKVSTDAAALGATAMPDPQVEPEFSWLYWASHSLFWSNSGAPVTGRELPGHVRRSFDLRTMRKFKARESLIWVVEYADIVGTPAVTVQLDATRVLTTIH